MNPQAVELLILVVMRSARAGRRRATLSLRRVLESWQLASTGQMILRTEEGWLRALEGQELLFEDVAEAEALSALRGPSGRRRPRRIPTEYLAALRLLSGLAGEVRGRVAERKKSPRR